MKPRIVLGFLVLLACLAGCARDLATGCYKPYVFEPYPPPEHARVAVTRQEAIDLAEEYGLEEGVSPWSVRQCGYDWCIESIVHVRDDGMRRGKTMRVDGRTGELLEYVGWDEQS